MTIVPLRHGDAAAPAGADLLAPDCRGMNFFRVDAGLQQLLGLYLDHMEMSLKHPSWWRGDYRSVAHWVPQFGMFALQRAMQHRGV